MEKLTKKQEEFAKNYLDTGNGTKSALGVYDTESENVAANIASENLRKPKIIEYLSSQAEAVSANMVRLALSAESEQVQVQAGRDVLDRAGYKPTDKQDITSGGEKINPLLVKFVDGEFKDDRDTSRVSTTL
jgi:phage terminase small subunit